MIKITDIIESTIIQSRELSFGFSQGLFNLSQLARFLKPIVTAKAKKDISEKALLMALSRMQRKKTSLRIKEDDPFFIEHVSLNTGLSIVTFSKNRERGRTRSRIVLARSFSSLLSATTAPKKMPSPTPIPLSDEKLHR